jgi:hypothetical protein
LDQRVVNFTFDDDISVISWRGLIFYRIVSLKINERGIVVGF